MRDRPEFDSSCPDDAELTAEDQAEVEAGLRQWRVAHEIELPSLDDRR